MAAIRVADLFASIGVKADVRQLNAFQKRLAGVKKQLLQLKRLSRTQLSPNTNIGAVRALNAELARTLRISRQIQAGGPISVRRTGGAAGGGRGGGTRGGGAGTGGFFGGAAASTLGVRGGFVQRNFLGGFTAVVAARQIFQATAGLEGIEVALGAVTREGQTTAEVLGFLRGEASRIGFDFASSALEYAKLAAAGNSVNLEQKTINETFIAAQEAARVFNLSVADTEGVLKAFTQIISKGKITAEELRNQLGDRLPGAVGIFANALGVTTQELGVMLEKGQVLADDDTLQKVAAELRATVADDVEAASRSLTASANRFRTALFEFSAGLGRSGISDIFKLGLEGLTKALKILGPLFRGLIRVIRVLLTPFQALGRIFSRFAEALPNFTGLLVGLGIAMFFLRNATLASATAWIAWFAPFLAAGVAIAGVILLVDDLATALEGGDSVLTRMADSGNPIFRIFSRILLIFGELIIFVTDITAALLTWSFDPLTDSLDRFISKLRELTGLAAASSFLTDIFESIDIGGNFQDAAGGPQVNSPLQFINQQPSEVQVTIVDGAGLVDRVETIQDGNLRQAQADFPNNE